MDLRKKDKAMPKYLIVMTYVHICGIFPSTVTVLRGSQWVPSRKQRLWASRASQSRESSSKVALILVNFKLLLWTQSDELWPI